MNSKKQFYTKAIFYSLVAALIILGGNRSFGSEWSKTFGGSEGDGGASVQQTSDGGFIITGHTESFGAGGEEVYLIKTDGDGNEQWSKTFGNYRGNSVRQTTDGGFIIAGTTDTACGEGIVLIKTDANGDEMWRKVFISDPIYCEGPPWVGSSVRQTSDGGFIIVGNSLPDMGGPCWMASSRIVLIKTDADGNEQWRKSPGDYEGCNAGRSVQQTSDGGYIVAGVNGLHIDPDLEGYEVYLIKTDADGNEQWSKTFGGGSGESVQQTNDGGYIIGGAGGEDVYLIKTDADGNEVWSKTFGGSENDGGSSVQQTADGGYIIAGSTSSFGAGSSDVYLIKTDTSGNEIWSKTFGGSENDGGSSVQQTADGGFIIAGSTSSFGADADDVYLIYYKPDGFVDVPPGYWAEEAIYKIYDAGITTGCSKDPLMYCPENPVNRDQMAVFLGRATHDSNFTPPPATGIFADVPKWHWAANWIEQFYADGLTKGCKIDPHDAQSPVMYYCPKYPVTRTTMAIFLLRAKHGANYQPPPATGIFEDVGVNYWAADWIEQLYREKITTGCKKKPLMYCPSMHVTRAQMAVFLMRILGL